MSYRRRRVHLKAHTKGDLRHDKATAFAAKQARRRKAHALRPPSPKQGAPVATV